MIKGVSKKVIEINYTNSDYIEKAILIINPKKSQESDRLINQKALEYISSLEIKTEKPKPKNILFSILLTTLGVLITTLVFAVF